VPWRGPEYEGELPSLGWQVLDWCADHLPSPRDHDQPLIFTDDQARLLIAWYTLDQRGRFVYRRGASRGAKGKGKSPLEAAKGIAELAGPVVFDGWDAHGEPVGRPWGTGGLANALVQIAAVSEDQTENTHGVVYELLTAREGKVADSLKLDPGLTRTYLRDGKRSGELHPVTASAGSREGQPVTYAVLDETHLWTSRNGGKRLARTLRRNVGKMNGRSYETTNSFVPGEQTVAEDTDKAAARGSEGVLYDAVEAPRMVGDVEVTERASNEVLRAAMAVAYGDAWWVDLDRLVADARDPDQPWEDVCRFNLNWNVSGRSSFIDMAKWDARRVDRVVEPGTRVGLGFDGSISDDATVLYGVTQDHHIFEVASWERPLGPDGLGWRVPRQQVHDAVVEAFATYEVGLMIYDPPKWWTEGQAWEALYPDRVVALDTNSERRFAPACDRFVVALNEGAVTHDGDERLRAHLAASKRKSVRVNADETDGRTQFVIVKADTRKIDRAVAAVLGLVAVETMPDLEEEAAEPFFLTS